MDSEGFIPIPSVSGNIDIDFMDQLFDGGCWLQTTDGSKFLQPGFTTSGEMNLPSYSLQAMGINSANLASVLTLQQEPQRWETGLNKEIQSVDSPQFLSWEASDQNSIWIAPKASLAPFFSVKERLMKAVNHFQSLTRDRGILIQLWVPVRRGGKNFLVTVEQPYFHDPSSSSLANYRSVSMKYEFSADEGSKEGLGLPGRVFLGKTPEWTPDVRFFRQEEYPRVNYAQICDVRGSIALPVFEKESGSCLGVVEIVTTTQKVTYKPEVESVCKALEAVDLRSSEISSPSMEKGGIEPQNVELSEISHIIRTVCDKHGLPIGQTWAPCTEKSKGRHWHSDNNILCASIIDSACYVRDQNVSGFFEACSEQQLFEGQGVVGKAITTNQPYHAIDVSAYSKAEYPLSHHAKMFGLRGASAVHLQCAFGAYRSYVLEFFLPVDCQDPGLTLHTKIMESVEMMIHGSRNVRFFSSKEATFSGKELSFSLDDARMEFSASGKTSHKGTSWISDLVEAQRVGKEVSVSFEFSKESREDLKVTTHWGDANLDSQRGQMFSECGNTDREFGSASLVDSLDDSSFGSEFSLGTPKLGEKKRTKAQKTISLEVLRQYFAGSLKDAARSIGVCPTTLKRICRQHGITRWPSRKIKKVGHSLKKLQVVIDSVQGAQGSLQLSSFYSDFPQLSPAAAKTNDQSKLLINTLPENNMFSSGGTTSGSTSTSHTSSSSQSFSTGAKASNACGSGDTSLSQDQVASLKRARSEAELHLPPLPRNSKSWAQKDGPVCKIKASFGEETIRLTMSTSTSFGDLQCEVARRFHIDDVNKMHIKYLDDDKEWVLLTCDDDLQECIDIQRLSESNTVKLSVHQGSTGELAGSLGSRAQS
ncbi:hypothetical protein V2J09_020083 [Rumex salicifolius]